jgi:hypothetical protein
MTNFFLPCEKITITPTSYDRKKLIRKQFNWHVRQAFRNAHPAPLFYEIHHILPVSLGGGNEWLNLALVDPWVHRQIHIYINRQIKAGHKRIWLPRLNGTVWHNPYETELGYKLRRVYG